MKKSTFLFSLLLILLASCNTSFHTTRQHAHRHYVRTDLEHPEIEEAQVEKINNQVQLVTTKQEIKTTKLIPTRKAPVSATVKKPMVKNKKKEFFLKATIEKIKSLFSNKDRKLEKSVKNKKNTNAPGVLNILSMVFGIITAALGVVTMFMFFFTIALPYTAASCITLVGILSGIGATAIILGVLGLSLGAPKRGMGIAGIITAGVGILIALLAMILYFVFL